MAAGFAGVWPCNRAAVDRFLAVSSQWRTAVAMDRGRVVTLWIGLDYAGAKVALDAIGSTLDTVSLGALQLMEASAIAALNGDVR